MAGRGIRLRSLISIVASAAFAALIISFTRDLSTWWPLFGVPLVISALSHHLPGAVVVAATLTTLTAVLHRELGAPGGALPIDALLGMAVLSGIALAVAARAHALERRVEKLSAHQVTDALTGVYTHERFLARLDEEISRASRYGFGVAVAVIEVDDLHGFRETFGHVKGDMLLVRLARLLENSLRNTDVLARFAEGFGVILPFTGIEGARAMVERVRAVVARAEFEGDELQPMTHQTISVGVSAYPDPATDRALLLDAALEGLGWCKGHGGDCFCAGPRAAGTPLREPSVGGVAHGADT